MSRYIDIETIKPRQYENSEVELGVLAYDYDEVNAMPYLDIVHCKDCKHNPKRTNDFAYGRCVCCCEDDWYGYVPDDDFFCGHGERIEK